MKLSKFKADFNRFDNSGNGKVLLYLIVFCGVAFLIYKIYDGTIGKITNLFSSKNNDKIDVIKDQQSNVPTSTLAHPPQWYMAIADSLYGFMSKESTESTFQVSLSDSQWKSLNDCTANDLKEVYNQFGIRDKKLLGFTEYSGNIFRWFDEELTNNYFTDDLTPMKKLWAKSGLWS